jgi:hypothetical protein
MSGEGGARVGTWARWALTVWACATSVGVPASALLKVRWQHGLQRKQSRPLSGFKPKELRDRED